MVPEELVIINRVKWVKDQALLVIEDHLWGLIVEGFAGAVAHPDSAQTLRKDSEVRGRSFAEDIDELVCGLPPHRLGITRSPDELHNDIRCGSHTLDSVSCGLSGPGIDATDDSVPDGVDILAEDEHLPEGRTAIVEAKVANGDRGKPAIAIAGQGLSESDRRDLPRVNREGGSLDLDSGARLVQPEGEDQQLAIDVISNRSSGVDLGPVAVIGVDCDAPASPIDEIPSGSRPGGSERDQRRKVIDPIARD